MLSISRLSLEDAKILIAGASAHARRIKVPMCIAVTDESGNLIAFARMDGSKVLSVQLAQDKAFTAAISRRPTHDYNARAVPGNLAFGIQSAHGGRFTTVGGGVPVEVRAGESPRAGSNTTPLSGRGGAVVGGIGCSSGTPEQDRECAEAGVSAFLKALKKPGKKKG
ncbi:MAG: heme-binding protein [Rhodospirillales bacterium]|nr:heme-binding protein [Rhodospirillales bacterium]